MNSKNEKIKRKYFRWLREANGLSELTVCAVEKAIWLYEDFTNHGDFAGFNQSKAVRLKKWLLSRTYRGKPVSITTVYHYLRHLKRFFVWLSGQPGYKSRISLDSVSYLSLEKKKVREATAPKRVKYPSLEYVRNLADSIDVRNEIDQRDRALIAFLLLSGMRDKAVSTLPIGCFDTQTLEIQQDPVAGVDTKFGKSFISVLFRFDDKLVEYVINWVKYLTETKLFASTDPLFPRSRVEQVEGGLTFISRQVEGVYWKGAGSIRQILKVRSAKAGLNYYHPHSYRHTAVSLAMRYCRNAEEIKAVSQNFGHDYIGTTMVTYGTLDDFRVEEIIRGMDFSAGCCKVNQNQVIEDVLRQLEKLKKNS
ncbi:MAG: site-specific integrase [bacterium]